MSNVLIGIIGVILFIGLALAGALFLGEDFLTASASSRAAAISSTLQQSANAVNMYELKTGRTVQADTSTRNGEFLVPRFLKQQPRNPHTGGTLTITDNTGSSASGARGVIWYTNIGDEADETSRNICRSIEEAAGSANPEASQNRATVVGAGGWAAWVSQNRRLGCLLNTGSRTYQGYIWF